jgi:hypothetical protein
MHPVTPLANADAIICSCGNTMEQHRCPSSIGYAPRLPKSQVCSACGLKQHQNLEGSTVRLECLWRQWAKASGQLQVKVGKQVRYAVPPPTAINVMAFGAWIGSGRTDSIIAANDMAFVAAIDSQQTETTSGAKRAADRAAKAPPMPNQSEPTVTDDPDVTADVVTEDNDALSIDIGDMTFNDNDEPTNADLDQIGGAAQETIAEALGQTEDYDF